MASSRTSVVTGQVLRVLRAHETESQTDGQLLAQFLTQRDEAALTTLVRRHGPMVLGVCRRVLGNAADAGDAFQATFLVLVRKAASLTARAVLGDWLHGVARRTAANDQRVSARRRAKEQAMARPEAQGRQVRDDWSPLLDEALDRLPEKYRLPIVLCELEGRTRREAAKRLGWPEGTVGGRLARGRALLAKQLARQGVAFSAGSLAAVLSQQAASACLPVALLESTVTAASLYVGRSAAAVGRISPKIAALIGAVVKAMFLGKLKTALAAGLVACLLAVGYGVLPAGQPPRQGPSVPDYTFEAVRGVPGAFQAKNLGPLTAGGKPLNAEDVANRAGKPDGFDIRVNGRSLFGMDYAHATGRREPLRPQVANLSDWDRASRCPPDRVLIDPRTGRLRFFTGHDPSKFKSRVTALRREMYGDSALGAWKGNRFYLSHWSIPLNLWAYDVSDPKNPRKIGEVHVPTKMYGLQILDSGLLVVGTERGTHCVDASDPGRMRVSGSLGPSQWFAPITSRYLAGWQSPAETTHFQ
jgi:RNA polymerase sigma factor (sigma-70 family)